MKAERKQKKMKPNEQNNCPRKETGERERGRERERERDSGSRPSN